jgi:hypothetical protein
MAVVASVQRTGTALGQDKAKPPAELLPLSSFAVFSAAFAVAEVVI